MAHRLTAQSVVCSAQSLARHPTNPTSITVTPPTPVPSVQDSSAPVDNTTAVVDTAAPAPAADDVKYRKFQRVAAEKLEQISDWLRHHTDVFTHLSSGFDSLQACCTVALAIAGSGEWRRRQSQFRTGVVVSERHSR